MNHTPASGDLNPESPDPGKRPPGGSDAERANAMRIDQDNLSPARHSGTTNPATIGRTTRRPLRATWGTMTRRVESPRER
jgi:hypothetical protein